MKQKNKSAKPEKKAPAKNQHPASNKAPAAKKATPHKKRNRLVTTNFPVENNGGSPCIPISQIQFTYFAKGPGIIAFFNIGLGNCLAVYGLRLVLTNEGKYIVLWPEHNKNIKGKSFFEYLDELLQAKEYYKAQKLIQKIINERALTTAAPTDLEYASYITNEVVAAYKEHLKNSKE